MLLLLLLYLSVAVYSGEYIVEGIIPEVDGLLVSIGPITTMPSFTESFGPVSSTLQGLIVSTILIPAAFASFLAGALADRLGRIYAMMIGAVVFGTGAALEAGSITIPMLITGRAVTGVGEGLFFSITAV